MSLFLGVCIAHATNIDESTHSRELNKDIEFWLDDQHPQTIQELLAKNPTFIAHSGDALNFGHTQSSIWVRTHLTLSAQARQPDTWFLEIGYANLTHADLYIVRTASEIESYRSGYAIPVAAQPVPHHNFVFPVHLNPGETVTLYLNVQRKGGAIQVPLKLWDRWSLMLDEVRNNYLYGAFFGVMYAMILYNLFLFVTLRLSSHFYYIAYLIASVITFHGLSGYGHLILWPAASAVSGLVPVFGSNLVIMLAIMFLRSFVKPRQFTPYLDKGLMVLIAVGPCLALAQLIDLSRVVSAPTAIYALITSIFVVVVAWRCILRGSRPAIFFLLGWTCLLIGVSAYALSLLGVFPVNTITRHGLAIGAVVEVILLSLGLADRFNTERKARYTALTEKHEALVRLKETENQLMFRALHSGTTGLPNRNLMRESLRRLIDRDQETETRFSVLLISFRNFHEFNKTLGHQNGDAILRVLAERMSQLLKNHEHAHPIETTDHQSHFAATVEGVIFGCIIGITDTEKICHFATQLRKALEAPFSFQAMSLQMDVNIGISLYPRHGDTPNHLLRGAQIALELAGNHPEQISLYNPDEDPYSTQRLTLLSDLRHAIDTNRLELYLQPQLDLSGSRVTGAEVLIRWKHPLHGFIPPDQFIPLAERTGVIQPLTYWVFQKAFSHLQTLNTLGHHLTLSVNISARNLQDPGFQDKVLLAAQHHQISPTQVVMELTETAMMLNENSSTSILYELDRAGFGIAIDDFGTGYSSLAYLKRLPVQEIKIDRTFIKDMALQQDDQVIVTTTLQMGHNLGLRVVAEGIEDATTLEFLRNAGCDLAQGYFIAKPMPFDDFVEWLNKRNAASRNVAGI